MKKTLLLISLMFSGFVSMAQIPTDHMIASYPLNNSTEDISGNKLNGIAKNTSPSTNRFNQPNSAYYLNGNAYVEVPYDSLFAFGKNRDFTVSAWIKAKGVYNTFKFFLSFGCPDGGGSGGLQLGVDGNTMKLYYELGNTGAEVFTSQSPLDSNWHFVSVALSRSADSAFVYTDGVMVGKLKINDSYSYSPSCKPSLLIGGERNHNPSHYFNGSISNVRIHSRVLTTREINYLYYESPCSNKKTALEPSVTSSLNGVTQTTDRFGNSNKAYKFDGIDDYINLGQMSLQTFTVSAWIYNSFTNPNNLNGVVSTLTSTPYKGFEFRIEPDNTLLLVTGNGSSWTQPKNNYKLANNTWYHVVANYTGSKINLYVNAELIASYPFSNYVDNATDILVGTRTPNISAGGWFTGNMDGIKIFDRSVDSTEVKSLFMEGICYQSAIVTDTLIINHKITGFNPLTYSNTIKVYPNPTSGTLFIDISNYNTLNQYSVKLIDNLGSVKFENTINAGSFNLNLSGYAAGLYHFILVDKNGKVVESKNIVLQ